ncbi:AMP-dependent synthetase/ligase [Streptomyces sp. MI02-7b]|uniref:AMP-dependent synthetase/ligase n=1 Tax=Streptomyces sp. MI02-7b TaxID=462941 RepID=UPI0029B19E89|nr:AMP-dependent synthetase/ligase [Streptomyces sp. MI02-7b]MDX3071392.1 AMP-dependent synthetase/ligase [Streptomyces sp. MI02-7b]
MREFGLPPLAEPLRSGGLAESVYEAAWKRPGTPALARRVEPDGEVWQEVSAAGFRDEVVELAKGLVAEGIGFGDPVAVMARTRYEWTLFAYALWSVGARVVPVYPTSSAEQVRWILGDSGAVAIVVEHEDHAMTVGAVCDTLPALRRIWQLDADCVRWLGALGRAVPAVLVEQRRWEVEPQSVAVVAYTSGTTGPPKGCLITHANLAAECDTLLAGYGPLFAPPGQRASVLAFLPMSHIYGLMISVCALRGGVLLGHQPDLSPAALLPAFATFRPTIVLAVPYIYEKIIEGARRAAERAGKRQLFDRAADVAVRWAEAAERHTVEGGPGPGPLLRAAHSAFERMVYGRIRDILGGRVHYTVSGGSPLSRDLSLLFAGAGLTIYDGYGLTETTAAITAQPRGKVRFGTVGRALPGCAVRIAPDGEVLVRGSTVFAGYHANPAANQAVWRLGGWMATGDVGRLDPDGYLTITGRKKDIIITSSGKSVAPLVLEERLRAHPFVSQCVVIGDNRPFIAALITLDPEAVQMGAGMAERDLRAELQRAVSVANAAVSRAESIRAFRVLPHEFSVANGLLTPSLKLRRDAILREYAAQIESIYSSSERANSGPAGAP